MEIAMAELNSDNALSTELTSEELNRILDEKHGLTEENVKRRRLHWDEMCYMLSPKLDSTCYISGSVREGVVDVENEESDLDIMIEQHYPPDVNINDSINIGFKNLTLEGKGPIFNDSRPLKYRIFDRSNSISGKIIPLVTTTVLKGPSLNLTDILGFIDVDLVPAFKCKDFPKEAEEWWYRPRNFNWPSQSLIDEIVSKGCHLVGIGSTLERKDEWRVSFSMAENLLVRSFNDTQLKCYFMLKQVLKYQIKPILGDTLCSYHMKTLMFWLTEETENSFWRKNNLKGCFMHCITELRKHVVLLRLRHYFLESINLFARKVNHSNKEIIIDAIDKILGRDSSSLSNCITATKYNGLKRTFCYFFLYQLASESRLADIVTITNLLRKTPSKDMPDILRQVQVDILKAVDVSHSVEKTCPTIFKFTTACIRLSTLITSNISNKESYTEVRVIMSDLKQLVRYDMLSGKLKLATVYLKFNRIRECLAICLAVLRRCEDSFIYLHSRELFDNMVTNFWRFLYNKQILCDNRKDMCARWITYEVIFSPLEIELVPEAVQQEMVRDKMYLNLFSGTLPTECWCYYDPVVYCLFLLMTCYNDLEQIEDRDKYLKQLEDVILNQRKKHCLVYPEAAENLVDYCRKCYRAK